MKNLFQRLLEHTHNGVYRYAFKDGRILMANQGLVDILDLDCAPADLEGKYFRDILIYTREEGSLRRTLETKGEIHDYEYHFKTLKGEEKWILHDSLITTDPDTGEKVVEAIVRDITEQKKAFQELARLGAAVAAADESIVITDTAGRILFVNPCFERMTGYASGEMIGRTPAVLKSGKHDAVFYAELWDTISAGKVWRGHFTNRKKDGTLFEEDAVISPVRDPDGTIVNYVAVKRDVTHELTLERQLLQSQKMEALGRMAGGVAHDFTNMITVITQHAKLADTRLPADSDIRLHLKEIIEASRRVTALTTQLLAFASRKSMALKVSDINKIVRSIREMLQRSVGPEIKLTTNLSPHPLMVKVDASEIEEILVQLVVNAKDAMPHGGQITLTTSPARISSGEAVQIQEWVEHRDAVSGDLAILSVSDSGCGMTEEIRSRVFEPFFTTKGMTRSSGLGLSTVYGIVTRMAGHISVYSHPGRGSTFTLYLPIADPAASLPLAPAATGPLPRDIDKVLVTEDSALFRKILVRILQDLQYPVLEAENGHQAIELVRMTGTDKSYLLFTDLVMPDMDGKTLSERLKHLCPRLKTIFTSGYPEFHLRELGVLKEHDIMIGKPFYENLVTEAIRRTYAGKDGHPASSAQ